MGMGGRINTQGGYRQSPYSGGFGSYQDPFHTGSGEFYNDLQQVGYTPPGRGSAISRQPIQQQEPFDVSGKPMQQIALQETQDVSLPPITLATPPSDQSVSSPLPQIKEPIQEDYEESNPLSEVIEIMEDFGPVTSVSPELPIRPPAYSRGFGGYQPPMFGRGFGGGFGSYQPPMYGGGIFSGGFGNYQQPFYGGGFGGNFGGRAFNQGYGMQRGIGSLSSNYPSYMLPTMPFNPYVR